MALVSLSCTLAGPLIQILLPIEMYMYTFVGGEFALHLVSKYTSASQQMCH